MNAQQVIAAIEWVEVSSQYEADTRRIMQEERFSLIAAVKSSDPTNIQVALTEAKRVAAMWNVDLENVLLPKDT